MQQNIQQSIAKIREFLKAHNIQNFRSFFEISFYANKEVIQMQEFVAFLKSPGMNLAQSEIDSLIQELKVQSGQGFSYQTGQFIDLEKLGQLLFSVM